MAGRPLTFWPVPVPDPDIRILICCPTNLVCEQVGEKIIKVRNTLQNVMDDVRDILLVKSRHQMFKKNEVETTVIKQTVEESQVLDKCRVRGHIMEILQKSKRWKRRVRKYLIITKVGQPTWSSV